MGELGGVGDGMGAGSDQRVMLSVVVIVVVSDRLLSTSSPESWS